MTLSRRGSRLQLVESCALVKASIHQPGAGAAPTRPTAARRSIDGAASGWKERWHAHPARDKLALAAVVGWSGRREFDSWLHNPWRKENATRRRRAGCSLRGRKRGGMRSAKPHYCQCSDYAARDYSNSRRVPRGGRPEPAQRVRGAQRSRSGIVQTFEAPRGQQGPLASETLVPAPAGGHLAVPIHPMLGVAA
jgi:hypothetical protein